MGIWSKLLCHDLGTAVICDWLIMTWVFTLGLMSGPDRCSRHEGIGLLIYVLWNIILLFWLPLGLLVYACGTADGETRKSLGRYGRRAKQSVENSTFALMQRFLQTRIAKSASRLLKKYCGPIISIKGSRHQVISKCIHYQETYCFRNLTSCQLIMFQRLFLGLKKGQKTDLLRHTSIYWF